MELVLTRMFVFFFKGVVLDHAGGDELDGHDSKSAEYGKSLSGNSVLTMELIHNRSPEKLYCDVMQPLQFGT